jgi:hypothetical protein
MGMPGFTAERCTTKAPASYRQRSRHSDADAAGRIAPAIPISPEEWYQMCAMAGCGAVLMPDGSTRCVCYHLADDMRQPVFLRG